jgi:hypothetical protein
MVLSKTLFAVGPIMDMNERQIALSVLESLRGDLIYAHLNNGTRILDLADLRQYISEQMGRIRTNAVAMDDLYGNDNGHGRDISKSNGHNGNNNGQGRDVGKSNGKTIWRERIEED